MTEEEYIEQEAQRRFEAKYGKDWFKNKESLGRLRKEFEQEQARLKSERLKGVEKAKADMRSGKTSTLVGKESLGAGKQGDLYEGVQGPLPFFKTQEAADKSGESRYLLPAPPKSPRGGVAGREMLSPRGEGIEVRKPEAGVRRMYRAIVQGDPASDAIFDSKEYAESYLKDLGLKGVVAGISFKGKTGEEIEKKGQAYVKRFEEQKERESELSQTYAQRTKSAQARQEKLRSAMAEFDAAETPEEKTIARNKMEGAQLEASFEQKTRGLSEENKNKLRRALGGVVGRRLEREAINAEKIAKARAKSQAQRDLADIKKEGLATEKQYQSILKPLYKASREARRKRNFALQYEIENEIEAVTSGVPQDERARRNYFISGAGEEWKNRLAQRAQARAEYEARERSRSNSNPTYY